MGLTTGGSNDERAINAVDGMCKETLTPVKYGMWVEVVRDLCNNRQNVISCNLRVDFSRRILDCQLCHEIKSINEMNDCDLCIPCREKNPTFEGSRA